MSSAKMDDKRVAHLYGMAVENLREGDHTVQGRHMVTSINNAIRTIQNLPPNHPLCLRIDPSLGVHAYDKQNLLLYLRPLERTYIFVCVSISIPV